jgi:hypothetical protein
MWELIEFAKRPSKIVPHEILYKTKLTTQHGTQKCNLLGRQCPISWPEVLLGRLHDVDILHGKVQRHEKEQKGHEYGMGNAA